MCTSDLRAHWLIQFGKESSTASSNDGHTPKKIIPISTGIQVKQHYFIPTTLWNAWKNAWPSTVTLSIHQRERDDPSISYDCHVWGSNLAYYTDKLGSQVYLQCHKSIFHGTPFNKDINTSQICLDKTNTEKIHNELKGGNPRSMQF